MLFSRLLYSHNICYIAQYGAIRLKILYRHAFALLIAHDCAWRREPLAKCRLVESERHTRGEAPANPWLSLPATMGDFEDPRGPASRPPEDPPPALTWWLRARDFRPGPVKWTAAGRSREWADLLFPANLRRSCLDCRNEIITPATRTRTWSYIRAGCEWKNMEQLLRLLRDLPWKTESPVSILSNSHSCSKWFRFPSILRRPCHDSAQLCKSTSEPRRRCGHCPAS